VVTEFGARGSAYNFAAMATCRQYYITLIVNSVRSIGSEAEAFRLTSLKAIIVQVRPARPYE